MAYDIIQNAAFDYLQAFKTLNLPKVSDYRGKDKAAYNKLIRHIMLIKQVLSENQGQFDKDVPYLSLYTKLHELAQNISVKENPAASLGGDLLTFHKQFFIKLYENDSKLFESIDKHLIKKEQDKRKARLSHINDKLKKHKIKKPHAFQFSHPENWANKLFSGLMGIDYNPLKRNNLPYIAFPGDDKSPTLLRMGTQVQGFQTLQPAFQNYLGAKNSGSSKKHHHVYINLLKRNMKNQSGKFERFFERSKTKALEAINRKSLGTTVITLPADNDFFFDGYSKKKGKAIDKEKLFTLNEIEAQLVYSIKNNKNDFHFSEDVKQLLFGDNLEQTVHDLLMNSAKFVLQEPLPPHVDGAMRQAILFDFVKFSLSNHIAQKLNPDTMNFSCKDAIDRGGVHALWYEFRQRIQKGEAMSENEFNMHLDASALLVKGRPVNDHRTLIWNVLNESFLHNPKQYQHQPWVAHWLVDNFPTDKKIHALEDKKKLTQSEQQLLNTHQRELTAYRANIEQLQAALPMMREKVSEPEAEVVHAKGKPHKIGHLHHTRKHELSTHLKLAHEPAILQSSTTLGALHDFLMDEKNQREFAITHVKKKKVPTSEQQEVSFELQANTKPVKVIAREDPQHHAIVYEAKKHIPTHEFEAVAIALSKVVLGQAKPGSTINFSPAPLDKRPILESVFEKAIAKAILEGKFNESNAPRIVKTHPAPSMQQRLTPL